MFGAETSGAAGFGIIVKLMILVNLSHAWLHGPNYLEVGDCL